MLAELIRKTIPARFRPIRHLENEAFAGTGGRVAAGPFRGMRYGRNSCGSCYIPKLLGIYERELNAAVEEACAGGPELIVDIGAAEGYYAVGLAIRNPAARVVAFEMEESGRRFLGEAAELNGKREAIEIRGKCEPADLRAVLSAGRRTLIVCDCEGYEQVLLDPAAIPELRLARILVETHDFVTRGLTDQLISRFTTTHDVRRIWQTDRVAAEYPFRSVYTRLLPSSYRQWAVGEWRPERMSWLWMCPLEDAK